MAFGAASADNVKLLCPVLYFHFTFGLILIVLGAVAILMRFHPKTKPYHPFVGQAWLYGIIIQIGTSLYCQKDGFRPFIFAFLIILMVGMIIGHWAIRIYQRNTHQSTSQEEKPTTQLVGGVELGGSLETPTQTLAIPSIKDARTIHPRSKMGMPIHYFKYIHGFCFLLAYSMLFGAGIIFTVRSKSLRNCLDIVSCRDLDFSSGDVCFQKEGDQIILTSLLRGNSTCPS